MPPGSSSSTSTQTQFLDCPGVVLAVPSPGCENYPFQLHSHLSSSTSTRSMTKHFAVEHHPSHEPPKEFSEVSGAEKARLAKLWRKIEAKRPAKPCV